MSTIATLIEDGEKVAESLVPPGSAVSRVVAALALQVEQIAGGELKHLEDKVLGIEPAPAAPGAAGVSAESEQIKALQAQLAAIEGEKAAA